MRDLLFTGVALAAISSVSTGKPSTQLCGSFAVNELGNWYCKAVSKISFKNVGSTGEYDMPVFMGGIDKDHRECRTEKVAYSGPLAPLNEEISFHFRGPLELKRFAAYVPSSVAGPLPTQKKRLKNYGHRGHGHVHRMAGGRFQRYASHGQKAAHNATHQYGGGQQRRHGHKQHYERAVGDIVTAVINGITETWVNLYSGEPTIAPTDDASSCSQVSEEPPPKPAPQPGPNNQPHSSQGPGQPPATSPPSTPPLGDIRSDWIRIGYYDAALQLMDGIAFLNNAGDNVHSGNWTYAWGNTLSYASSTGVGAAVEPQILFDAQLGNQVEIAIFTDRKCDPSDPCGYVRPGTVAYHGFDGPSKAFILEFTMPNNETDAWYAQDGVQRNEPAIWVLNAHIPRTAQYDDCSCWTSGCGEFDVFEFLDSDLLKAKATLHAPKPGGDSNYFERPINETIVLMVVMDNDSITIQRFEQHTLVGNVKAVDAFTHTLAANVFDTVSNTDDDSDDTSVYDLNHP